MIFLYLFYTFCKIGLFGFGGGYAMLSMIQVEVVTRYNWISASEFTDIIAISQMTPGPIGINSATYVGYTAVLNAGYNESWAIFGSCIATFVRHYDFVVAKDGSGDFFTIQEAIHAVPDFRKAGRTTILVRKGVYKEKVVIPESKISISLIGEDGAILTNDDFASKKNYFGEEMSTSGSSTCYIYAPDFYAENITFENSAGRVGQAVACFVSGDRAYFKNCRFLGNQDTLYTYGKDSRQFYDHCYIEGTVDFIFGWSTALFKDCTIHSLGDGYVTAPSTDQGKKYGYVFIGCKLTGVAEAQKVYLSRPWRPYAQAVYIHCDLGKHILPVGWNNWGKKENEETVFYAEYRNTGEGAATASRASFGKQLNDIGNYNEAQILAGDDGWNPVENGNVLLQNLKR